MTEATQVSGGVANPSTPHALWTAAAPNWTLVDDLRGGSVAMRAKSDVYLPRFAQESDADYKSRVDISTLYDFFVSGVKNIASSLPFAQDVELTGPAELKAWENDVDRMGNDLTQFTKNCLLDLLFWGRCIILVDSPIGAEDAPTVAEQQDQRLFPYFIRIPPALARNWLSDAFERYERLNVLSTVEEQDDPVNEWELQSPPSR